MLDISPDKIFENKLLKDDGLFVLEHGKDLSFEDHPYFLEHRHYGSVNFTFFAYPRSEESEEDNDETIPDQE